MRKKTNKIVALAIGIIASGAAQAQYYRGFDLAKFGRVADEIAAVFPEPNYFLANTALDDRRIRYGLKLGYRLAPNWALVGNYSEFDRHVGTAMLPLDSRSYAALPRSYGMDLVGTLPVFERWSLTGNAGLVRFRGDTIFGAATPSGLFPNPAARALSAGKIGVGVQYNFSQSLGLRFAAERYRNLNGAGTGELDAENYSLGLLFKF